MGYDVLMFDDLLLSSQLSSIKPAAQLQNYFVHCFEFNQLGRRKVHLSNTVYYNNEMLFGQIIYYEL